MSRKTRTPYGYCFKDYCIPDYMVAALQLWIESGISGGHFLDSVISNNLFAAVSCADTVNLRNLPAYVGYLFNEAPAECWGSPEQMDAWEVKQSGPGGLEIEWYQEE